MISLAYIVRNESAYIGRSIRSAIGVAAEVVVIDAESSDDTAGICRGLGAKVVTEPWRDDFSHAKNLMVSHCSHPWILNLDADEHLEGENLGILLEAIKASAADNIVAWQLPRKNHYPSHDPDSPFFTAPFYPDYQTRLFRNDPKRIFFSGRVHEGVVQAIEAGRLGDVGRLSVCIHHHMFRGDQEKHEKEKAAYYKRLEQLQETP